MKISPIMALPGLILLAAGAAAQVPQNDPATPAPLEIESVAGAREQVVLRAGDFSLDMFGGKTVLIDFWASWCKPCRKSMPWLSSMQDKYHELGLVVVAVNMDKDLESAGEMLADLDPRIILVHDPEGEVAGRFEVEGMPSAFLFDREGKLQSGHTGFRPEDEAERDRELYEVITMKSPAPPRK